MTTHTMRTITWVVTVSLVVLPGVALAQDPMWPFWEDIPCHPQLFTTLGEYQCYRNPTAKIKHPYLHDGLDILHPRGSPIRAIVEGTVTYFDLDQAAPKDAGVALRDVSNPAWRWLYGHVDGEEFKRRVRLQGGFPESPEGTIFGQGTTLTWLGEFSDPHSDHLHLSRFTWNGDQPSFDDPLVLLSNLVEVDPVAPSLTADSLSSSLLHLFTSSPQRALHGELRFAPLPAPRSAFRLPHSEFRTPKAKPNTPHLSVDVASRSL